MGWRHLLKIYTQNPIFTEEISKYSASKKIENLASPHMNLFIISPTNFLR